MSTARRVSLVAAAQALFPPSCVVADSSPITPDGALLPPEAASATTMVPHRRAEFTAGRLAARAAMQQLGRPPVAIPMGADRAPIWPEGIHGSISHGGGACLAVLTTAPLSPGLDIEPAAPLAAELRQEICTKRESLWLQGQNPADQGLIARAIFSIKEACYKAQYPLSGQVFGFDGLEITLSAPSGRFSARFTQAVPPFPLDHKINGFFRLLPDYVLSGAVIPQGDPAETHPVANTT